MTKKHGIASERHRMAMHGAERRQKSMKMSWKSGELIEGVLKRVGKAWR